MKKLLVLLILLAGCGMDDERTRYFNQDGIRFAVSGNITEAKKAVLQARLLLRKTELMNTEGLEQAWNSLKLENGTEISVSINHGMKTAKIYAPPQKRPPKPKPRPIDKMEEYSWHPTLYTTTTPVALGSIPEIEAVFISQTQTFDNKERFIYIPKGEGEVVQDHRTWTFEWEYTNRYNNILAAISKDSNSPVGLFKFIQTYPVGEYLASTIGGESNHFAVVASAEEYTTITTKAYVEFYGEPSRCVDASWLIPKYTYSLQVDGNEVDSAIDINTKTSLTLPLPNQEIAFNVDPLTFVQAVKERASFYRTAYYNQNSYGGFYRKSIWGPPCIPPGSPITECLQDPGPYNLLGDSDTCGVKVECYLLLNGESRLVYTLYNQSLLTNWMRTSHLRIFLVGEDPVILFTYINQDEKIVYGVNYQGKTHETIYDKDYLHYVSMGEKQDAEFFSTIYLALFLKAKIIDLPK